MFFVLSKIAYFFISPFTWILIAFGCFLFFKNKKWKKRSKYVTIGLLIFFSNTFIYKEFVRLWEIPSTPISKVEQYDVAIVLGGMFEYDNSADRLTIRRGGDRIWQALSLYHLGKVKKILISGDSGYITDRGLHEAEQLKNLLVEWNIPAKDIIVEPFSRNTYENALETTKILRQSYPHFNRFLLITSATHMRRAEACFKKQNLACTVFTTDQFTGVNRSYHWDEFIVPSATNLNYWTSLIKEWIGYVSYKIVGYI